MATILAILVLLLASPASAYCPDVDNDRVVTGSDFNIFRLAMGSAPPDPNFDARLDWDEDELITGADFNAFKRTMGKICRRAIQFSGSSAAWAAYLGKPVRVEWVDTYGATITITSWEENEYVVVFWNEPVYLRADGWQQLVER